MRKVALLLLIRVVVWGRNSVAVSRLLQTLREETSADQAVRDLQTIRETDRWFTFPKFEETAKNVAAIVRRAGRRLTQVVFGPCPWRRTLPGYSRLIDDTNRRYNRNPQSRLREGRNNIAPVCSRLHRHTAAANH